jgi:phosphate transport system substrate-binding protein
MSDQGQKIVEDNGYIAVGDKAAFTSTNASGKIVVAGSSSVTPVMEKLQEAYVAINTNAQIEIQQSDSTTGITSVADGVCDIGMASRDLKQEEIAKGLTPKVIAKDGIAVIVNNSNTVEGLTSDQVKSIFTGEVTSWADVK